MKRSDIKRQQLGQALRQLELAVAKPIDYDGRTEMIVQRFELSFELAWKVLKHLLEDRGVLVSNPREVLLHAFTSQLIEEEDAWLKMLRDRNLTVHTYDEHLAKQIIARIESVYVPLLQYIVVTHCTN